MFSYPVVKLGDEKEARSEGADRYPEDRQRVLGVGPRDEEIIEVRGREVSIKPRIDPTRSVEEFCSIEGRKLTERIDLKKLFEEEVEERIVLR
ncbi:MAG: hypothetical protein RMJ00_04205 [Nitrososphaerota archaeon]|nr:hypothetical protein [Candidatus Bathyarchaeota archaeon]MDW8061882.1 hypothetical protein [Nitrososphaerota archaeon]